MRRSLGVLLLVLLTTACTDVSAPTVVVATTVGTTPPPTPTPTAGRTSTTPPAPAYRWRSERVTAADLSHSWHAGCPVPPSALRVLTLDYVDFGGATRQGRLVVHRDVVTEMVAVFRQLYAARYPIRRMVAVDVYGGDDDRSMADDNTSGFNCRNAVSDGPAHWSEHAYGKAVDVNPVENPYLFRGEATPPAGAAYRNRGDHRPGMAWAGGLLVRAFSRQGFDWGGGWSNPDYQHFSENGR